MAAWDVALALNDALRACKVAPSVDKRPLESAQSEPEVGVGASRRPRANGVSAVGVSPRAAQAARHVGPRVARVGPLQNERGASRRASLTRSKYSLT
jgi:hypothetical protein